jgi:hypothetical protein
MSHPLGLASRFTAELVTIKGPLLERSGFFVSVGNIPSPICHAVEKIISFGLLKKGHMQGPRNLESGVATNKERLLATPASW